MMPSNSIIPSKPMSQETNPTSGSNKKVGSSSTTSVKLNPPEQALKCPRCDSSNTKFCYYNNYNLSQPRHFCKTCRRYWTKGGALRNVPIGGGCRKNKRISTKSSSRNDSSSIDYSISPSSSENISGLKFFPGISSPSMEFQLGGGGGLPFSSRLISTNGVYNQFLPYGDQNPNTSSTSTTINNPSFMGFNFHGGSSSISDLTTTTTTSNCTNGGGIQEMGSSSINVHSNLASSIESLSCINQDLHWKLQQQRLGMGMLFGDNNHKEIISNDDLHEIQTEKTQPILFQNLDISKPDGLALGNNNNQRKSGSASHGGGNPRTEWFFENTPTTNYIPNSNININPTTNNNNINRQGNENPSGWDGFQGWTTTGLNHQHYNGLQE